MNKICIDKYDGNEKDFVWALCSCINDIRYGIKIPRKNDDFTYCIFCPNCNKNIIITAKGKKSKTSFNLI